MTQTKLIKLKILQINNYGYVRGGSDRYFLDLSNLLIENGHEISYLSSMNANNLVTSGHDVDGFDVDSPSVLDIPKYIFSRDARNKIRALLSQEQPDLVHLHIYYGQITASILQIIAERRIPIIQTLHEYKMLCPVATMTLNGQYCDKCADGKYWNAVANKCNRDKISRSVVTALEAYASKHQTRHYIDHYIAVSNFVRDIMLHYGTNPKKVTTIHNFIKSSDITPNSYHGDYFFFFGRLDRIKGVMTLLKAMKEVDFPLIIAGEGEAKHEMKRYIEEQGLTNITMIGFKKDKELKELILTSRCVIVPSEWCEPFGLVLLEAFIQGKPVIASRIGGITEIMENEKYGYLISPGNVKELVEAMRELANRPDKAVEMGARAIENVKLKFSAEAHYKAIMAVYKGVMCQSK